MTEGHEYATEEQIYEKLKKNLRILVTMLWNNNYAIVSTRRFQYMKTGEFATYFLL